MTVESGEGKATSHQGPGGLIKPHLRLAPPAQVGSRFDELIVAAKAAGTTGISDLLRRKELGPFLGSVLEYSPFLRGLMLDDPARLAALLAADPKASLKRIVDAADDAWKAEDQAELMRRLRRGAAGTGACSTALADLGGVWDVVEVTAALTAFADAAVGAAARFVLAEAAACGTDRAA